MAEFRHETKRLILRDWREEDWAPFWEGTNTPEVMRWLGGVMDDEAIARSRARLDSYREDYGHTFWVVERREDSAILGFCGLKRCTEENGPLGTMEAGWRFRENAWGQGYAKEAPLATLRLGFERFEADEIIALTVRKNTASWGLMLRIGMEHRPHLDFGQTHWSGQERETIVYSIKRESWEERRG